MRQRPKGDALLLNKDVYAKVQQEIECIKESVNFVNYPVIELDGAEDSHVIAEQIVFTVLNK
jgi:hypothetical protein